MYPIQLPQFDPVGGAVDIFTAIQRQKETRDYQNRQLALQEEAQRRLAAESAARLEMDKARNEREEDRLDFDMRQRQQLEEERVAKERSAALKRYQELTQKGLPLAAAAELKPWGITLAPDGTITGPNGETMPGPSAHQAAPTGATPQGGSPLPDGMEFPERGMFEQAKQAVGLPDLANRPPPGTNLLIQAARGIGLGGFADKLQAASGPPVPNPLVAAASRPAGNPLLRAAQSSRMRATGPGGEDLGTVDPNEAPQAWAQRALEFEEAFKGVPMFAPYLSAGIAAVKQGTDPQHVYDTLMKRSQDDAAALERARQAELNRQAMLKGKETIKQGMLGSKGMQIPNANDSQNRSDLDSLNRNIKMFTQTAQFTKLNEKLVALNAVEANMDADTALAWKDVMIQLGRFFRGAAPTESEMAILYHGLGGTPNQIMQWWRDRIDGKPTKLTTDFLRKATEKAREEVRHMSEELWESAKIEFGPGSGFEAMEKNVNTRVRGIFRIVGLEPPEDIYPNAQTQAVMGSGVRARTQPGGVKKSTGRGVAPTGAKPKKKGMLDFIQ